MKNFSAFRSWVPALVLGAASLGPAACTVSGQTPAPAAQALLDKAHALEVRGRMDMAAQTWQQVLLADPNNTEALGGLARAAKLSGNLPLASTYLDRLRAINPNDPGIARAENMGTQADHNAQLQQAGKLAQQGQYAQSIAIYRKLYGNAPPPGDQALAYYETESATEDGRPHAIEGLRALSAKYPSDSRYSVALGRILTYNPKTRPEGRRLLSNYPDDPQAADALRQSLLWDAQNPATAGDIRAYLSRHNDAQLSQALRNLPVTAKPTAPTAQQRAAAAVNATRTPEDQAAYRALNAKHLEEAEQRFKAILAKNPEEANALAGMGYVRMQQANFGGALSYLSQAKQDGSKDPGLEAALATSRFWNTMGEGAIALNDSNLPLAEKQYRAALTMRPTSTEALEGLGGTLLKAQQPEAAIPYFQQFVRLKPSEPHAWRGLFLSLNGSGNTAQALASERGQPSGVRAQLARDPLFLRSLASAYSTAGRDADAQRVLRAALDLPFPADAKGVEAETQLQYAGLLQQANHLDQAGGLYRQVLVKDPNSTAAAQGLVRVQHAMGQDQQAVQTLEAMPLASFERAMREPGFESTVASIYQAQRHLDAAQEILEKSIARQQQAGLKPSVPTEVQLAGIYLERNNPQQAYPLYRQILTENPNRTDAWKGLLASLHSTGRDSEALAQVQQIPAATRAQLENDVDFLQTMGSVYNALGQPQQAQLFLRRVQQHYAAQNTAAPADVDVQNAWLLYNGMNDAGLYRQLMMLGSRADLTDEQRRTVQTIWANWAVRRANQAAASGDNKRSLAILNATAASFPDNPGVVKALAGGYARAGMSKQAVAIWRAQNLTTATATDYRSAVGAALAADDQKDAETWLRFALDQYPKDADLLILGAKFEQARGDNNRAADYYRASLDAMPPADPGAELATELSRSASGTQLPASGQRSTQDLATLLAPGSNEGSARQAAQMQQMPAQTPPYLPGSATSGNVPVPMGSANYAPGTAMPGDPAVPSYMAAPAGRVPSSPPASRTRLRDYVPQASEQAPLPADATELPATAVLTMDGPFSAEPILTPAVYQQQQIARATSRAAGTYSTQPLTSEPVLTARDEPPALRAEPQATQPFNQQATLLSGQQTSQAGQQQTQTLPGSSVPAQTAPLPADTQGTGSEVYGPYVPYHPPTSTAVQLGATPTEHSIPQPPVTDVLPAATYKSAPRTRTRSAAQASVRRQQAAARSGQSAPPAEVYNTPAPAEAAPAPQTTAQPLYQSAPSSSQPAAQPVSQAGDSIGQQYPQPYTAPLRGRTRARRTPTKAVTAAPEPAYGGMSYPGVGQTLGYQPYPTVGSPYQLGPAPTDADLIDRNVPPLRGRYYRGELLAPSIPLTPRQQTERDLAILEASYSGWLGGTGSARYRSGTPGLDRLTDLEATAEASVTFGNNVRLTVVPRAVFLNSGALDSTVYAGQTTGVPVIGTLPASSANAPSQQFVNGVGGELQLTGTRFAAAVGYTPYEFLVRNVTGRVLFRPTRRITLYGNRDVVNQTQLSYAGLRDPGSATAVYAGNIWGGVVSTGGGIRFDYGDEKAGFYLSADGADLTGYHVLENTQIEGSMGAYFLAHTFPGYGKLNVGASLFGMHYAHNERGLTYGLGGYFSPDAYFLASVPVTFTGRYGSNFHYSMAGSVGVQTFQESDALFFPLDRGLQSSYASTANGGLPCTAAQTANHTCAQYAANSNTGGNYAFNTEGAYRIAEHWFAGGFLSANNTNNYNTVTGGFFVRYLFRPQYGVDDYPTGLFPVEGFRPLRVP